MKLYKSILSCLLLSFITFAADYASTPFYKNSFGWESGLSYNRHFSKKFKVGINIYGRITDSEDSNLQISIYNNPDSSYTVVDQSKRWNNTYYARVKLLLSYQFAKSKSISADFYFSPGFSGNWYDDNYSNDSRATIRYDNSVLFDIGIRPEIRIFKRFSLGTKFGLNFTYRVRENKRDSEYDYLLTDYESESKSMQVSIFGTNFSLAASLFGYFYF